MKIHQFPRLFPTAVMAVFLLAMTSASTANHVFAQASDPGSIGDKFRGGTFGEKVSENPDKPAYPAQIEPGCLGGETSDQASDSSSNNPHCPLEP